MAPEDPHLKTLLQDAIDKAGFPPASIELPADQYNNKGQATFQLVEYLTKNLDGVGKGMGLW